jgi:DUF1365 family protein
MVMHQRLRPVAHRFSYRVFSLLVDLDRLAEADRLSRIFSVNRANLVSFHEADHAPAAELPLRSHADRLLAEAGLRERPARILLLAYPRVLGYVFNPISVYFAYDQAGHLLGIIYAVNNTFGDHHAYVAPVAPDEMTPAGLRQSRLKRMHVSPFMTMDARYDFRLLPPGRTVRLRIHETEAGEPTLAASFVGTAKRFSTSGLLLCLARMPVMTWKVTGGIHFEALKLWLKGAAFYRRPPPPPRATYGDGVPGVDAADKSMTLGTR